MLSSVNAANSCACRQSKFMVMVTALMRDMQALDAQQCHTNRRDRGEEATWDV